MITCSSPGKLYIAGEYAVIEKGQPSIIIAVDQFIKVTLKESEFRGSIQAFDNNPIMFDRENDQIVLDYRDNNLSYVINSIKVVEALAQELKKDLKFYDLIVDSELQNEEGKKYGLGSSAAVTVSTVKVLCKLYGIDVTDLEIFKLCAIVHLKILSNGSCGDIAASVFTGWISFKTFDREWVSNKMNELSLRDLINTEWPYLEVKRLTVPDNLNIMIGWTEKPSSTTKLVDNLNKNRKNHKDYHRNFLKNSEACVNRMIEAFENSDLKIIKEQVSINRELLKGLENHLGLIIETNQLTKLIDVALEYGGSAKSSGAGGGDCGIAIFDQEVETNSIMKKWDEFGIKYLPLNVYFKEE